MLRKLIRNIHYDPKRKVPSRIHSDMRDIHRWQEHFNLQEKLEYTFWQVKLNYAHYYLRVGIVFGICAFSIYNTQRMQRLFHIEQINALPPRQYDKEDYDYKYWELGLATPREGMQPIVNTKNVVDNQYALLYHATLDGPHMSMLRFSRLKAFILARKDMNIQPVFVCMDDEAGPGNIVQYTARYSSDILGLYPPNADIKEGITEIFNNLGCIYVMEANTGNVVFIIDPSKHTLEQLGHQIMNAISRVEDSKMVEEWMDKNRDFRQRFGDLIAYRRPEF